MFLYTINIQSNISIFILYEKSKVKSKWKDKDVYILSAQDEYHNTCP